MKRWCLWTALFSAWCGSAAAQGLPSLADLVEKIQPAVVNISTSPLPESQTEAEEPLSGVISSNPLLDDYFNPGKPARQSLGSGFIIDKAGYIITNHHVIDQAQEIDVTLFDGRQTQAELVGKDAKTDIALIKIDMKEELPAAKLGNSDGIRVGDWVVAVGNPFGLGNSVSAGIVSAKSRDIETGPYDNFIQTDASINQGSSGGPMFNMAGEVIGINTAIFSTNGGNIGIGFAVPITLVDFVIKELKSKGKVERGWLGLKIQANSADIAGSVSQPQAKGVVVSAVTENSSAAKAGLEAGDIIVSFDGRAVEDPRSFSRMAAETAIGKNVKLEVWRNKALVPLEVRIEAMPEEAPRPAMQPLPEASTSTEGEIKGLGLSFSDLTPEIINRYHLGREQTGVIITAVKPGSDAEAKGLAVGNLISEVDKKPVFDMNDLRTYVDEARMENNRPVLLLVSTNNIPHYAAIKLNSDE